MCDGLITEDFSASSNSNSGSAGEDNHGQGKPGQKSIDFGFFKRMKNRFPLEYAKEMIGTMSVSESEQ